MQPMIRITLTCLLAFAALVPVAAAEASRRGGGPCPGGRPATGDLGFDEVQCIGGACSLFRGDDAGFHHEFTVEPRLWALRPGGPAAGVLEEGDTLVAVDGQLVTTRQAGRRLANLEPGRGVELRVRRDGRELTVSVTPVEGCGPRRLVSTSDPAYRGGAKDGAKGGAEAGSGYRRGDPGKGR